MIERLIPQPYRLLLAAAIAVAVCAACFAAGLRWSSNSWSAKYLTRENTLLTEKTAALGRVRELEQERASKAASIDAAYQQGLTDGKDVTARTVADLRAGNLQLRRDLSAAACRDAGVGADSSFDSATAPSDVWRTAAEDLVRLADEADDVVKQLTACQALLISERTP